MRDDMPRTIVLPVGEATRTAAIDLLVRFLGEEGFAGDREAIDRSLQAMLRDPYHWAALAARGDRPVGVVTVPTMMYVERACPGDIGDLFATPEARRSGIGRAHAARRRHRSRRRISAARPISSCRGTGLSMKS